MPEEGQGIGIVEDNFHDPRMPCFARFDNLMAISFCQGNRSVNGGKPMELGIGVYEYQRLADPIKFQPVKLFTILHKDYYLKHKILSIQFLTRHHLLVISKSQEFIVIDLEKYANFSGDHAAAGENTEEKSAIEKMSQTVYSCERWQKATESFEDILDEDDEFINSDLKTKF
jgi:hypothetical protein